ncbi:hypothetical protein LTR96_011104 [Exophiala xenobiotica]|nr:hypothetical protein LTR41_011281 [Exophiala xenobiotica]KAK5215765.1 hypothetical protein LTR72_011179 [Exophiala xenobiotica]KAK5263470.1 hypothetical protein LTR96_011104 [Exophiala xenobiotica]KAK5282980.1 hypothetical protein LTR40_002509 [Exophiala xenobiotica]KAK5332699.1 hypothetical protein LTR98_011155 [Exophiala xenobiotica]
MKNLKMKNLKMKNLKMKNLKMKNLKMKSSKTKHFRRMGPTDIDMLLLKLADDVEALLEPTETVVGDDMPVLVVLEIEEVVVVLEPIGLTLAEGFEVVLALIGATEEELEAYQSFQA